MSSFRVGLFTLLIVVSVAAGCGILDSGPRPSEYATPISELPKPPDDFLDTWVEVEISDPLPRNSTMQPTRFFSVMLPPDWTVRQPMIGADSWSGALMGGDMELSIVGGPFSIGSLTAMIGDGPIEFDAELARRHVVTEETVAGFQATIARPQLDELGITGARIDFPSYGKVTISGRDLSKEQQSIAFEIIRSIKR